MTKGELLLYWLTHVREGSWPSFRRALQAVEAGDEQLINVVRMRSQLSELAHVEFFISGTNRWQTFAPLLGGLCGSSGVAALCGGRTPRLVETLARSCDREGCLINVSEAPDSPDQIQVAGSPEAVSRVALRRGDSICAEPRRRPVRTAGTDTGIDQGRCTRCWPNQLVCAVIRSSDPAMG